MIRRHVGTTRSKKASVLLKRDELKKLALRSGPGKDGLLKEEALAVFRKREDKPLVEGGAETWVDKGTSGLL